MPSAVLVVVLVPDLASRGADVYGRSLGEDRLTGVYLTLLSTSARTWMLIGVIMLWSWVCAVWVWGRRSPQVAVLTFAGCLLLLVILVVDMVVYGGDYGSLRYRALLDLTLTLQVAAAVALSISAVTRSSVATARLLS